MITLLIHDILLVRNRKGSVNMSKLIYTDTLTNENLGDYNQTMERLKNQPIRQQAFKRFTDYYYNNHGWFAAYLSDLYVINIKPTKEVN